jgi:cation diffusion facilitator CzcD-associated flavoprotein CzcO
VRLFDLSLRERGRKKGGTVMSQTKKNVCVIGAGASGLVAAKELLDEGHRVTCFERYDKLGGVFCPSADAGRSGAYDSTRLTISNYMMGFSSFPPPRQQERRFWSAREYHRYLTDFARHFGVDSVISYGAEVVSVKRADNGRYDVEVRPAGTPAAANPALAAVHQFDAVAVTTGTHRVPRQIELPGQSGFDGEIHHSAFYRNAHPFRGKRVLCIGIGETAADVVNEIAQVAESCTLSVRRHQPVIRRYPGGGEHTNDAYTSYMLHAMPFETRNRIARFQFRRMRRTARTESARVLADWNLENSHYNNHFLTKNEAFLDRIVDGSLIVNSSGIERLGKDYVLFKDGREAPVDAIMLNTGYTEDFGIVKDADIHDVRHLYKHMIHPEFGAGLVFIGWARPAEGGVPACSEMQSRYFALLCSGKKTVPERIRLTELIARQAAYEDEVYLGNPELRTLVHYTPYMSDFSKIIGCSPWRPSVLRNPRLVYRLWCGSQMPHIYRLFGPHSDYRNARETIFNVPIAYGPLSVALTTSATGVVCALIRLRLVKPDPAY